MYSTATPVTARAIARRTARAASRTSPLTCSADSIPKNANISSSPDSPRRESEGNDPNARFSVRTCERPSATNAMSGTIFATVAMPLRFDPSAAPRMLTTARPAMTEVRSVARGSGPPTPGNNPATASANTVETAPIAAPRMLTTSIQAMTDVRNAARRSGPPTHGNNTATPETNTVDTAPIASVMLSQSSTPHKTPAQGLSTDPTYAYGPPLCGTRL